MYQKTITYLSIVAIVIGSIFLANGLILAWTVPGSSPPGSNASAPLNVGSTAQTKSGSLSSNSDIRAPIFYDQNNTGYYVDPAGTTRLNAVTPNRINITTGNSPNAGYSHYAIYEEPGTWAHPYPDLMIEYHTGIKYIAYYGYGGHRFYTGYSPDASPNTLAFSIGEGDHNVRVTNSLYVGGGATVNSGLTVGNAAGAYTYITLRDDESPNGVKYIHANSNVIGFLSGAGSWLAYWDNSGNMQNTGNINAASYSGPGCDIAERYESSQDSSKLEPGDIVVLDENEGMKIKKSERPYDTMVIGVVSTNPNMTMGVLEDNENHPPVALLGRVPTKVTTENGSIKIGDLIVSSSKPGYGMKCDDYNKCQGVVVGKATENLESGEGLIEVLIRGGF